MPNEKSEPFYRIMGAIAGEGGETVLAVLANISDKQAESIFNLKFVRNPAYRFDRMRLVRINQLEDSTELTRTYGPTVRHRMS